MNFYQFYNMLNEYGQNTIEALTKKFQSEFPGLSSTVIASYIDKFDRIKNNLTNKDINTYSWRQLEEIVDGYGGSKRIKAGKFDTNAPDTNLLYNQNKIKIYLGKNRNSCIKYGDGYTFCISARGQDSMYGHYRIDQKATPYFVFNENLPHNDNRHLIVLLVYEHIPVWSGRGRYSVTLADNRGDNRYDSITEIIKNYPWMKPITNFVEDPSDKVVSAKGHVDVEPLEHILYFLEQEFQEKIKQFSILSASTGIGDPKTESWWIYENSVKDIIRESSPNDLQRILQNDLKIATAYVYQIDKYKSNYKELLAKLGTRQKREEYFLEPAKNPGSGIEYRRFSPIDNLSFTYNKPSEVVSNVKKVVKSAIDYLNEYDPYGNEDPAYSNEIIQEILNSIGNYKEEFIKKLNTNKKMPYHEIKTSANINQLNPVYIPYFAISLFSPKEMMLDIIDKNKEDFDNLNNFKRNHNKQVSWLKTLDEDKLNIILKQIQQDLQTNMRPSPSILIGTKLMQNYF